MNLFQTECPHKWSIITKTYAAPVTPSTNITDASTLEKSLFGVTSYMQQCEECGALRKQEMLGTDENQLDTIIENVEREGMQYIKKDGAVYAVAKWAPKVTDSLPLK